MLIDDIKIISGENTCELRAQVWCDTFWVWGDQPFPLWYRFPKWCEPFLSAENGDPFVAAFLPAAMALAESLEIRAPVSAKLLDAVPEIQTIYRCWNRALPAVSLQAPTREHPLPSSGPAGVGLFFSLGVDSSYSLLKNEQRGRDGDRVSHLIVIEGCDIYLWESQRFPPLLANIHRVAMEFGKQVLPVTTNLREFSDRMVDWLVLYHGPALASVALALGELFHKVHIAAAQTYAHLIPRGAHPLLDPLWGTPTLSFIHDGLEARRLEKIRFIASCAVLVENLRVCTTGELTDAYNCGRCEKCLRTMIGLHIVGALNRSRSLPHEIDTELVRSFSIPHATARDYLRELADALGCSAIDLRIKAALEACLDRNTAGHGATAAHDASKTASP